MLDVRQDRGEQHDGGRMNLAERVTKAIELMNAENVHSNKPLYSFRPIPCELDQIVRDLVELFMKSSLSERNEIIKKIPPEEGGFLICFAGRMATMGVRERSRERLLQGLVALIMEGYKEDFRDTLIRVGPIYDASLKIGLDAQQLFDEAAEVFANQTANDIKDFPNRPPDLRSLRAMGYKESSDSDGFKYERDYS